MTPREIDLLEAAFRAFLGRQPLGERFLLTNASIEDMVAYYARVLRASASHEAALQHVIDHGAEERERLLGMARERNDTASFRGQTYTVLTEHSGYDLEMRKPAPPNTPGVP